MVPIPARSERLEALRAEVRAIESAGIAGDRECLPFGIESIDARLAGGGLACAALHEVAPDRSGLSDDAAATLFLASIAARRCDANNMVLWALSRRDLFAPGLAMAGLSPDNVLYAECGRDEDVLAVMEEGLRHGGLAAVIGEVRKVPMAATRRLQLAAEEGGTMALMLKRWRRQEEDPLAAPSAAVTRWRVGCAPSGALPVAGIGRPRWRLDLARQRGGEPHHWIMEGPDAKGRLALPDGPEHRPHPARAAA
ncbi:ImuA family protein [Sphingosinicella sp. BN140058]|uniref:ImuA family protein n=1 Tax=Sphingosinicella sp. BN140058 TaxID=1892855 RepID=UPI00101310D6|nr:protein ImuA [Sphingosinicella sp. BN140058]QAY77307.1 protein ImuA [Sphingosinicella sp. BN140058]